MTRERRFHGRRRRIQLSIEVLEDRTVPTVFTPTQIQHAYGFDQINFSTANGLVKGNGAGQTIAIVDAFDDPNIASDLHHFDQQFGIADPPSFTKYTETGTRPNAGWAGEIALDVEWAHAIAPGANIVLVEARSSSLSDLLSAVNFAADLPGVSTVSMSWGGSEFAGETADDADFLTPAGHQGVTFVASAGDNGEVPSWPSVSPNVLSVGGTSLTLNSSGNYGSESAWLDGGGGNSRFESKPTFQGFVTTGASTRSSPDVAYNADPNTGVYVYDSYNGGWFADGGTSAGAPQWAALVAIADQGRALEGKGTLDGSSQTLDALYRMAQTSASTYFHDVTTGSNGANAKAGYDDATGNGSPIANQVVAALVGWNGAGSTGSLSTTNNAVTGSAVTPPGTAQRHDTAMPISVGFTALAPDNTSLPAVAQNAAFAPSSVAVNTPSVALASVQPGRPVVVSTFTGDHDDTSMNVPMNPPPAPVADSPSEWGWLLTPNSTATPIEMQSRGNDDTKDFGSQQGDGSGDQAPMADVARPADGGKEGEGLPSDSGSDD